MEVADRRYHVASLLIDVVVWTGENDTKTISVDQNLFENGLVWTGLNFKPKSLTFHGRVIFRCKFSIT